MRQPADAGQPPQPYDQPPFAPWPERDPDMLDAAADTAAALGLTRSAQDAYAVHSHAQALRHVDTMREEIVAIPATPPGEANHALAQDGIAADDGSSAVATLAHDAFPRALQAARVARMPAVRRRTGPSGQTADCSLSPVAISPKADGAALVLLASPQACRRWNLHPRAAWLDAIAVGGAPESPMLRAQQAAHQLLQRNGLHVAAAAASEGMQARAVQVIELHDAFAAQGLAFADALGLPWTAINAQGGGLARGHPIGASGAIALVRALAQRAALTARPGAQDVLAMASVAGAGGLGSATLVGGWHE
jgi:acetyl-CoA C-acetyltransferase